MVCLCASCHQRADLEKWGEKVLRRYKELPWILRKGKEREEEDAVLVDVEIRISMDFDGFDGKQERWLRHALANFLELKPEDVEILRKERGSLKLTVRIPLDAARRLCSKIASDGTPLGFGVDPVKIEGFRPVDLSGTAVPSELGWELAPLSCARTEVEPHVREKWQLHFHSPVNWVVRGCMDFVMLHSFKTEEAKDLAESFDLFIYDGFDRVRAGSRWDSEIVRLMTDQSSALVAPTGGSTLDIYPRKVESIAAALSVALFDSVQGLPILFRTAVCSVYQMEGYFQVLQPITSAYADASQFQVAFSEGRRMLTVALCRSLEELAEKEEEDMYRDVYSLLIRSIKTRKLFETFTIRELGDAG